MNFKKSLNYFLLQLVVAKNIKIKLSTINLILNFKRNLIEDFYQQNQRFNAMFAKESKKAKTIFTEKRLKRVKDIIKHE